MMDLYEGPIHGVDLVVPLGQIVHEARRRYGELLRIAFQPEGIALEEGQELTCD